MEYSSLVPLVVLVLLTVIGLTGFYSVEQQEEAIVERFGKFVRIAKPGLNYRLPMIESVYKKDMRVQQMDVDVETKTLDNVFVNMKVSVQYQVSDIQKATYKLTNSKSQIASYVFDVIRAQVPKLTLDAAFEKKDDVAHAVKSELAEAMSDFGFSIVKALVTDISPDQKVKDAMNEINAAARLREAATQKAEADKILAVKKAEGEAESKALQGQGIARERQAIVEGLKKSCEDMSAATGLSEEQVMVTLLTTQYFDTLKSMGENGASTILLPYQPGSLGDLQTQILASLQTNKASNITRKSRTV